MKNKKTILTQIFFVLLIMTRGYTQTWPLQSNGGDDVSNEEDLSSAYGPRNLGSDEYDDTPNTNYNYDFHLALDIGNTTPGREVYLLDDGELFELGNSSLTFRHADDNGDVYLTRYNHIDPNDLTTGFTYDEGTVIGVIEDNGDHLDFRFFPADSRGPADRNTEYPGQILPFDHYDINAPTLVSTYDVELVDYDEIDIIEPDQGTAHYNPPGKYYFEFWARVDQNELDLHSVDIDISTINIRTGNYEIINIRELLLNDEEIIQEVRNGEGNITVNGESNDDIQYRLDTQLYNNCGETYSNADVGHNGSSLGIYPREFNTWELYHTIRLRWYIDMDQIKNYKDIEMSVYADDWWGDSFERNWITINDNIFNRPIIEDVFPTTGDYTGGTTVTIQGSNFGETGTVKFGDVSAKFTSWTEDEIICTTPAQSRAGEFNIEVIKSDGFYDTDVNGFWYTVPPDDPTPVTNGGSGSGTLDGIGDYDLFDIELIGNVDKIQIVMDTETNVKVLGQIDEIPTEDNNAFNEAVPQGLSTINIQDDMDQGELNLKIESASGSGDFEFDLDIQYYPIDNGEEIYEPFSGKSLYLGQDHIWEKNVETYGDELEIYFGSYTLDNWIIYAKYGSPPTSIDYNEIFTDFTVQSKNILTKIGNISYPTLGMWYFLISNNNNENWESSEHLNYKFNLVKTSPTHRTITFDQKDVSHNSYGHIDFWDDDSWSDTEESGSFAQGYNHYFKADNSLHNNQKFNRWNTNVSFLNHTPYKVDENTTSITAYHNYAYSVSFQTNLSGATFNNDEKIQIKDPWYADFDELPYGVRNRGSAAIWKNVSNVITPSTTGFNGIFLDQDYNDPTQIPYELKALATITFNVHSNNIAAYFLNWDSDANKIGFKNSTNHETQVIFKQDNATATARYKGHLASNNSHATGYNNGRRLAKYGSDLYLVYEDGGKIWYTHSADDGASWDQEELLASPSNGATCANPAITLYQQHLYVTWVELYELGENVDDTVIWFSEKDVSSPGTSWINTDVVWPEGSCEISEKISAPAIAVLKLGFESHPIIFYDHNSNNELKIRGFERVSSYWCEINNLNFNGEHPSLSADTYHSINSEYLGLVYDYEGTIYLRTCYNDNGSASWSPAEAVSQHKDWIINQSYPNISMSNTHAHVTWEAFNTRTGKKEVKYREYLPGNAMSINSANNPPVSPYNVVTTFSARAYDLHSPTIGSDEAQNVAIYYQKSYEPRSIHTIYKKSYNESTGRWQTSYYSDGRHPSMADHALEGTVWTKYNEAPYLLKSDVNGPSSAVPHDIIGVPIGPQINSVIDFTFILEPSENNGETGYLTCSIDNASLNGDQLIFNDSLYTDSLIAEISLIPVELEMKVFYENVNIPLNPHKQLFKAEFIDQNNNVHMTSLRYHELPDSGVFIKSVDVANLHYREGNVRIFFPGREPIISYNLEYYDDGPGKYIFPDVQQLKPESYNISQNYPNPFNPITHVTFELPEVQHVDLSVFNIQGKKVKELINSVRRAGIHEVVFDGSELSSGVYFYRINAGSFTEVKRMLLIK